MSARTHTHTQRRKGRKEEGSLEGRKGGIWEGLIDQL